MNTKHALSGKRWATGLVCLFFCVTLFSPISNLASTLAATPTLSPAPTSTALETAAYALQPKGPITIKYHFARPEIARVGEYHSVTIEGLPKLQEPGLPMLPVKAAKILVPFDEKMEAVRVICGNKVEIEGTYVVEPGHEPVPISHTGPVTRTLPSPEVYDSSEPFPGVLRSEVSIQEKRGYEILVFTLYPVEYIPQEGKLSYYEDMTVEVDTEPFLERSDRMLRRDPRHWAEDRAEIREIVDNPEAVESYPSPDEMGRREETLLNPLTPYDYVIVTNQALEGAPGPNNFQALRDAKQARGISAVIITTEWISATYSGLRPDGSEDLQTKIRNFVLDAYQTWDTEYVLLGGDGDGADVGGESGDNIVPARGFASIEGEIDYDIPADMYYGCLDGTFDYDADGIYAEPNDGPGGGEVDLYAEVYVGRAAVDSADELANFIAKTLAYENENDAYLRDAWMVGENLGWPAPWGGDRKDDILNGSSAAGYTTVGFKDSPYATFFNTQTLYDRDYPGHNWPKSEIIDVINSPAHIINHLGHANVDYVMKMYNADVDTSLTNDHYFIGYSQGCYDGSFDNRSTTPGSYYNYDSISEHLTTEAHGAVAFVSNSRYGWGDPYDPHLGASQYYDRQFWDAVLGENIFNVGRANQDSKEDTYGVVGPGGFDWIIRWVYYELNVFGDPELVIKTGADSVVYQSHTIDDDNSGGSSGDGDGRVDVGETIEMPVTLFNTRQTEVTAVMATLSVTDPFVSLTSDLASYGDMAAGGSATSTTPYVFSVDLACPDDHWITFTLGITGTVDITGTIGTWSDTFQVEVHSEPQIEVSPTSFDETLEWGGMVTRVMTISNTGPGVLEFEISKAAGNFTPLKMQPLIVETPAFNPTANPAARMRPSGWQEREAYSFVVDNPRLTGLSYDVLLVSPDSSAGDISQLLATLNAYPDIHVTVWDNSTGNPTATDMQPYCATIIGNDFTWESAGLDKSAIGDALADYIDDGGKVIESLYVQSFDQWGFGGRYLSGGYSPFTQASTDNWSPDTMNVVDPSHPVMQGVTTVSDNWGHQNPGLAVVATLLAAWDVSGYNYVAVNDNVVALNQLIFHGADWTGDVGVLLHNAIGWLCEPPEVPWLFEDPITGTVAAHSAVPITITVDASQVNQPGIHRANLRVSSNDPYSPTVNVPVTMTVQPNPDMGKLRGTVTSDRPGGPLEDALVDVIFGTTSVISGTTDAAGDYGPWWLTNGAYTMTISADGYFTDTQSVSISAGVSTTHDVVLTLNAPQIEVSPTSFDETLEWGGMVTRALTISNTGPAALEFEIGEQAGGFTPLAEIGTPSAEPTLIVVEEEKASLQIDASAALGRGAFSAGGPDAFGYIYRDSNEPGGPTYNWIEIAPPEGGSGTPTGLSGVDDGYAGPFPIEFVFPFYGADYTQFYVGSNGTIYFEDAYLGFGNECLPGDGGYGVETFIAHFWDDLVVDSSGEVYYEVQGSPGNRRLVVEYYNVRKFGGSNLGRWEIILNENGDILMQYQDAALDYGASATIGIQNDLSIYYLEYSCNTAALADELAIWFGLPVTDVPWLFEDPITGTVAAHSAVPITITVDASQVTQPGIHRASLRVSSNDPYSPTVNVPVTMTVEACPTCGKLMGTVTSDRPGGPLEDALVDVISGTTSVISGTTGASGDYGPWWLVSGTYSVTVSADGYLTETQSVSISAGVTTTHNVTLTLNAPQIAVAPTSYDETLDWGETVTRTLTITNNGPATLGFELIEIGGQFTPVQATITFNAEAASLATGANNSDQLVTSQVSAFYPLAIGDFTSKAPSSVALTSVTVDPNTGYIYAQENSGYGFYRYNPYLDSWTALSSCPIYSGNNGGAAYLNGKIYTVYTENSSQIGLYDIATDSWSTISNGLGQGTGNITTDGQCIYMVYGTTFRQYDPASDTWSSLASPGILFEPWGGLSYLNGTIYGHTGNGTTGFAKYDIVSNMWTTLNSVPSGAVLGSAIDPSGQVYYAYGSYGGSNWYAFDLASETWSVSTIPLFSVNDGGMAYVGHSGMSGIYFVQGESGTGFGRFETAPYSSDVPWLTEDPITGTVPAYSVMPVTITFDASKLDIGTHEADIVISSNDPDGIETVPVTLTVHAAPIVQVTNDPADDWQPAIVRTNGGKLWVVWDSWRSDSNIWYKISNDNGATWSADTQLTTDPSDDYGPVIMQANNGTIWVVWYSYRSGNADIWYKTSAYGGAIWSADTRLTTDPNDDYNPAIMQTSDGTIWVLWYSYRSGNADIWYKTSSDGGATWSSDVQLTTAPDGDYRPAIAQTGDGTIWVLWDSRRPDHPAIWYKTSTDSGASWSPEAEFSTDTNWDYAPTIAQTSDGTIWVARMSWSWDEGKFDIWYKTSSDGGASWSADQRFTEFTGWDEYPGIAALPGNQVALVWSSDRAVNYDIWFGIIGVHGDVNPPPHLDFIQNYPWPNPDSYDTVTIRAQVSDETGIVSVILKWWVDGTPQADLTMYDDGAHDDYGPNDGWYGVQIGPFPVGTVVEYQVEVTDVDGNTILAPQYPMWFESLEPFVKTADILFVPDNGGDDISWLRGYYEDALEALGYPYDVWDTGRRGEIDLATLNQYTDRAVIWAVPGWGFVTRSDSTRNTLQSFLDNGGNLFITGQDIGYYADWTSLYQDYLHATYVQDDSGLRELEGVAGDPISDGLSFSIIGGDGANNQYWPDEIDPIPPAVTILTYSGGPLARGELSLPKRTGEHEPLAEPNLPTPKGSLTRFGKSDKQIRVEPQIEPQSPISSDSGGIRVDTGTYKVVYFAFGFEAINSAADRQLVMERVLDWTWSLAGDLDFNCVVNVADIMKVANRWRMVDTDSGWNPRYDLNDDGIITVVDIMLVVKHWGKTCGP